MRFMLSNDIGNDKMKVLEPNMKEIFKMPNVYKKIVKTPPAQEHNIEKNVINLMDELIAHITSDSIRFHGMYMIGERALQTTEDLRNMDISNDEKHLSDLPIINTLGYIAARAVQKEYKLHHALPEKALNVEVFMSCAIPASQHNADTAKHLEDRFTKGTHIVVVYVGKETVTVQIKFNKVKVTKEGVPALYAIFEAPEDMFEEYKQEYGLSSVTGKDFIHAKIMHNDIGSGTVENIYTIGVNPRPHQCTGERYGVGHAIQNAITLMREERPGLKINRQQFVRYIEHPEEYPKDSALAIQCLKEARLIQIDFILSDIESKYNTILASEPEIVAVYGGGSIEFKEDMYSYLKQFTDSVGAKLLWIPSQYAVDMNVKGLDILNRNMFFKEEYAEIMVSEHDKG